MFKELLLLTEHLLPEYALAITTQLAVAVPYDNLKQPDKLPELQPLLALMGRFLPRELLEGAGNAYAVFADAQGKQAVTVWTPPGSGPSEQAVVSCSLRLNILETNLNLVENVFAHSRTADDLFDRFNSGFLGYLIKP